VTSPLAIPLENIASCFEGIVPCSICTVAEDGTPNITYISLVHLVDADHVALSRQFFKKTEANTVVNPFAQIQLSEPGTGRQFLLDLEYERTETAGPRFERMKTNLDAVAAHEGMAQVFTLRGTDICRVLASEMVPCHEPEGWTTPAVAISRVQAISQEIAAAEDLDGVITIAMDGCQELLGYPHAFIMLTDESGRRLYTVASAGFNAPGTGSEVRIGEGVIGLAAERRQTIRLTNLARDISYFEAAREGLRTPAPIERIIPLPNLPAPQSQLVVPMLAQRRLVGVISLQSQKVGAFTSEDECVVGILASQMAIAIASLGMAEGPAPSAAPPPVPRTGALQVKHYSEDDTIFLDNEYLIKGVAGGILWRLLNAFETEQRSDFSNKEIRLDQSLDLPDIKDNLEARLILLRKRLEEREADIQIEKTARGRFRLVVKKPLQLVSVAAAGPL
jgi:adenylate cyclase